MRAGGVGTVRAVLQWSAIESTKGDLRLAKQRPDPHPARARRPRAARHRLRHARWLCAVATDAPTNDEKTFDAWADFLAAAAARYGADGDFWTSFADPTPTPRPQPIREWEIWNEPNSSTFWAPTPDPDAYADLLKRSAKIIHEADPEAKVMSAGMFATPQSDGAIVSYDFLAGLFDVERRRLTPSTSSASIPTGPTSNR